MGKIKRLDAITVTRIAAGEVIDRPASIVKELLENAIDAGADKITLSLLEGGKREIKITDNGCGISAEDLPLAPIRHATSKIDSFTDIYGVPTFGFRGEALASIAHVAELDITSKTAEGPAYHITAKNHTISKINPTTHPQGSTIVVKHLFSEIPVRAKFLKSNATEMSYCLDIAMQFAVLNPHIDFVFHHDQQRDLLNTTGIADQETLVQLLYSKESKDQVCKVESEYTPFVFKGLISKPTLFFSNKHQQILAFNGRLIKNATLQKAISMAYQDHIPKDKFPLIVLNILSKSTDIDVNIHPQKSDIKFLKPGLLFDAVKQVISSSFKIHKETDVLPIQDALQAQTLRIPEKKAVDTVEWEPANVSWERTPSPFVNQALTHWEPPVLPSKQEIQLAIALSKPTPLEIQALSFFQVYDTYLVVKTPKGLFLFDQHAVHERILYEKFKTQNTPQERQLLLIPHNVPLSMTIMAQLEHFMPILAQLNFIVEPFGKDHLVIREIPLLFSDTPYDAILIDLLTHLKEFPEIKDPAFLQEKEILQMKACKAAIKAGKKMSEEEVKNLLHQFIQTPEVYTCPHGRPLYIHMTAEKLEKLFLRT